MVLYAGGLLCQLWHIVVTLKGGSGVLNTGIVFCGKLKTFSCSPPLCLGPSLQGCG